MLELLNNAPHWYLALVYFVYYAVHSLLASEKVKKIAYRVLGLRAKTRYRLFYSIFSTVGFVALIYWQKTAIPLVFYGSFNPLRTSASGLLLVFAIWIIRLAFNKLSAMSFIGLRDLPEQHSSEQLIVEGVYRYVRHPLYSATLLILTSVLLINFNSVNLVMTLSTILYLPFGIFFEEKKLINQFGNAYLDYKSTVKAVIPGVL